MKRTELHDDAELLRRLMQRRVIDPVTGCWIWPGGQSGPGYRKRNGYGVMWNGVHPERITHIVARIYLGYTKGRGVVCHHCDCPPCWNPAHLFVGSHKDNMQDAKRKGRIHPWSKVTREQVEEIRSLYQQGGWFHRQLAEKFGLSRQQVSRIIAGHRWPTPQEVLH